MTDSDQPRLARLVSLVTLLQSKRLLTAQTLAHRFSVSTRTIYRDMRTLEQAGVPVVTEEGKGYTLLEGYRLPPVMFTREEAVALLTAEKLTAQFTDPSIALLYGSAMDKLKAALRRSDRHYLETIEPYIQVQPMNRYHQPDAYHLFVTAITQHQVVQMNYQAAESRTGNTRLIEPIGLYLRRHWHVIAYCRFRGEIRDFRLDRIQQITLLAEQFKTRTETLEHYWALEQTRRSKEKVILQLQPTVLSPALTQQLQDTKHQYGWIREKTLPEGGLEMTFLVGSLSYMASWLLQFAGDITIIEPLELRKQVADLAEKAFRLYRTVAE